MESYSRERVAVGAQSPVDTRGFGGGKEVLEKKTRVLVKDYPLFRDEIAKVIDNLKQDLIIAPKHGRKKRKSKKKSK